MTTPSLRALWILVLSLIQACEPPRPALEPDSMELLLVRPKNKNGVYLNEPLVFDFSHDLDRSSVTSRSLRIELPDGTPARGEVSVEGGRIRFQPAPVLSPKLNDGGYLPGLRYTVTLLGFPSPDCLRGAGGEPLVYTRQVRFTTVKNVQQPREDFIFADNTPDRCAPLFVVRNRIGPDDAILLGCSEPLDPSSLLSEDFQLIGPGEQEPIPLRVRLIQNFEPSAVREAAAVIELLALRTPKKVDRLPAGAPRDDPNLLLQIDPSLRLTDFGGNPVPVAPGSSIGVYLVEESPSTDRIHEAFLDTNRRLPVPISGVEGTALWDESRGQVRVRYPKAAGLGTAGDVVLAGSESRTDIHAVRLHVADIGCELTSRPGLCVLRSQGKMVIDSSLVRRTNAPLEPMRWSIVREPDVDARLWLASVRERSATAHWADLAALYAEGGEGPTWNDLRDWFDLARREMLRPSWDDLKKVVSVEPMSEGDHEVLDWAHRVLSGAEHSPSLSPWLDRARDGNENWTVLVAGGDLVIEGTVEVDTPLLLVAGGMIRIQGEVRAGRRGRTQSDELFLLGEGGGRTIQRRTPPLDIDEPQYNPLVRPMSFGVLSKQIPQEDGPIQWKSAVEKRGQTRGDSSGTLTVHYVRDVPVSGFDPARAELFEKPNKMDGSGPIHFYIQFDLPKAPDSTARGLAPWSPPFLDAIILTAEPN